MKKLIPPLEDIEGAIFDMDGTLLDSMHEWRNVAKTYLAGIGIEAPPDIRERVRSLALFETAEMFRREFGVDKTVEEIERGLDKVIEDAYLYRVELKPGAAELLAELKARGVRLCLATATNRHHVKNCLTRVGIYHMFDAILTTGEAGLPKSEPEFFHKALSMIGTDKDKTPVFEDALYCVRSAKSGGYFVVGVYDRADPGDPVAEYCDVFLEELSQAFR